MELKQKERRTEMKENPENIEAVHTHTRGIQKMEIKNYKLFNAKY